MVGYIKSHSNYRLQSRHQLVNNGTIFERDISTVGGVNSFATGQSTIYQSGNFVIVTNNRHTPARYISGKEWLASGNNTDLWDASTLENHSSDIYGSVENSIMLKNDFMDLRSFAYYGSLSGLIENTITNILTTYPYELYCTTSIEKMPDGTFVVPESLGDLYEVQNPGRIDIYSTGFGDSVSECDGQKTKTSLGYFYDGGKENYSIYSGDTFPIDGYDFEWNVEKIARYRCVVDSFDGLSVGEIVTENENEWLISSMVESTEHYLFLECFSGDVSIPTNGQLQTDGGVYVSYVDAVELIGACRGMCFAKIEISPKLVDGGEDEKYDIYAFWDDNLNVRYFLNYDDDDSVSFGIRPKMSSWFYEDFIDSLDLFGKCLMGVYSGLRNTAKFEILSEGNRLTRRKIESYTFPTSIGGYNLASDGIPMEMYISGLAKIGNRYDDLYTDNLYRMMTHDSLKNLDWTDGFNGQGSEDNVYVNTGQKFASVIRLMGYVFDQEKAYIDSIGNVNTITYSNRSNLSDYFLTDSLETDGWVVNNIYIYILTEFNGDEEVPEEFWDKDNQESNEYTRKFSENTYEIIDPYNDDTAIAYYLNYSGGTTQIDDYSGQTYYVEEYVCSGNTYNTVCNVIKDYRSQMELSAPDVNNEFMKRLRINSRNILRKKGTVESVESMLAMFGMKSKRWCDSISSDGGDGCQYDFDIQEYTYFTPPITDEFNVSKNQYEINWYNSVKTISYPTESYLNGEYIDYQGLPVKYIDYQINSNTVRKLYPHFSSKEIYDGGMYYQMNGGWLNYVPYRFGNTDIMLKGSSNKTEASYVETMGNVMLVRDIKELISQRISELYENEIFYVTDLTSEYALINGYPYEIKYENVNNGGSLISVPYFNAYIYGSSISVGGVAYMGLFKSPGTDGSERYYNLDMYSDGSVIRIYYTGNRNNAFSLSASTSSNGNPVTPETSYIFSGGCYSANTEPSNYFQLTNIANSTRIGEDCWRQVYKNEQLYLDTVSAIDNYNGNNPHSGNYKYDHGEEYLNRFRRLFKYASENRLFDESCFPDVEEAYDDIDSYGFNGISVATEDTKVHAFIDRIDTHGNINRYNMEDNTCSSLSAITGYEFVKNVSGSDSNTAQIINTKNFKITFYLPSYYSSMYSKEGQEYTKYIQSKIMPYVEQLLPSTSIIDVDYQIAST